MRFQLIVRLLLLILPLALSAAGCKKKKSPQNPVVATPQAQEKDATGKCAPGLYLTADPVSSLTDLPAPTLNIDAAGTDDLKFGVIKAATFAGADVIYYRGCPNDKAGSKTIKCEDNDPYFIEGLLWEPEDGEKDLYKDPRYWVGPTEAGKFAKNKSHNYLVQGFNCVWWDSASGEVKNSGNRFSIQGLTLYCGEASKSTYITFKSSNNDEINYKAQNAQYHHDKFIAENFKFYQNALTYANRIRNGNPSTGLGLTDSSDRSAVDRYITNIAAMGPSNLLAMAGSGTLIMGAQQAATGPAGEGFQLASGNPAPIQDCAGEEPPPPPPPPPPAVQEPPPAPPPPPPPPVVADAPAEEKPEPLPPQDPYARDKEECRQRDLREKAALGDEEAGTWEWTDARNVCTYKEPNGTVTFVPDVGEDIVEECPTDETDKRQSVALRAIGGTMIGLGALGTLYAGYVAVKAAHFDRRAFKKSVIQVTDGNTLVNRRFYSLADTTSPKYHTSSGSWAKQAKTKLNKWGASIKNKAKQAFAYFTDGIPAKMARGSTKWTQVDGKYTYQTDYAGKMRTSSTTDLPTGRKANPGPIAGIAVMALLGVGSIVVGSLMVAQPEVFELAAEEPTTIESTVEPPATAAGSCVPPSGDDAQLLQSATSAGAASLHMDEANYQLLGL